MSVAFSGAPSFLISGSQMYLHEVMFPVNIYFPELWKTVTRGSCMLAGLRSTAHHQPIGGCSACLGGAAASNMPVAHRCRISPLLSRQRATLLPPLGFESTDMPVDRNVAVQSAHVCAEGLHAGMSENGRRKSWRRSLAGATHASPSNNAFRRQRRAPAPRPPPAGTWRPGG